MTRMVCTYTTVSWRLKYLAEGGVFAFRKVNHRINWLSHN